MQPPCWNTPRSPGTSNTLNSNAPKTNTNGNGPSNGLPHPQQQQQSVLRPMYSPATPATMGSLPMPEQPGEVPIHVVGSQGRRGILPSAPGRPTAPAAGTGAGKNTVIPVKDADGKFPCPHCTKTYLHAKHLKRHLLRHTGDRPYMCVLCRDTFSRRDILKRHFQKCSIRRGNPTGATHLQRGTRGDQNNIAAHQRPAGAEGDMNHVSGMNQLIRPSSMGSGDTPDRRSMPGPGMGNSQPYPGDVWMSSSMPPGQNAMPMYGGSNANQHSSLDWSQMFEGGAHRTYVNNSPSPHNLGKMDPQLFLPSPRGR